MSEWRVRLEKVTKRFGGFTAVDQIDLAMESGEFFSIIGPSGCGKTTTLRMIAGLELPDDGRILVGERDITRLPAYRRPVNTVFQSYALFPHLDVSRNVGFGLVEARRPKQEIQRRVDDVLDLVQLTGRTRSQIRELSGGQQQRVALARALINQPDVLLLDEPLGALDMKLRRALQRELKAVQRRVGITFVYVTHDQEEAFSISDRVAVMNNGLLEQVGTPTEVYEHPATSFVASFVGEANLIAGLIEQNDGDGYIVRPEGGPAVRVSGPPGLRPGGAGTLIVRPENVRIGASDEAVPARLLDVAFLGHARSATFDTPVGNFSATVYDKDVGLFEGVEYSVGLGDHVWFVPNAAGENVPQETDAVLNKETEHR